MQVNIYYKYYLNIFFYFLKKITHTKDKKI